MQNFAGDIFQNSPFFDWGRGLKMILGQALSPPFFLEPLGSYNLSPCVHYALLGSRYGSQFMCDLSKNLLLLSSDPLRCFVL